LAAILAEVVHEAGKLVMRDAIIRELQGLDVGRRSQREKQDAHRVAVDAMLVNGDACQVFRFLMPTLALLAGSGGPEGWMWFNIVHFA